MNAEALLLSSLRTIVIDASYLDQKQRGILDMKETHVPLAKLLTSPKIKSMYGEALKLLFF